MPDIRLEHIGKIFKASGRNTPAVLDLDLHVGQGEFVFLVGSRGAGKSTLLDLIAGELPPDRGTVYLDNVDLSRMNRKQKAAFRNVFGRVRQDSALVRTETIFHNFCAMDRAEAKRRKFSGEAQIQKALALVGMKGCEDRFPREFSYSECRRIELAKALLYSPPILLLDELTNQVDDDTLWDMVHLLDVVNKKGSTVLMATHSRTFVNVMRRRVITLVDGRIIGDVRKGRYGDII